MKRAVRYLIIRLLLALLFTSILIESTLHYLDPWGVVRGLSQNILVHVEADPALGYRLAAGTYNMDSWTVTIKPDHTRLIPHTHPAACRIVIAGDSVAMPVDVNDDQTWPDLLAREFPGVEIVNPSVSGYNIGNALRIIRKYKNADGILYLMIGNDAEPDYDWSHPFTGQGYSAMSLYWYWATHLVRPITVNAKATNELPVAFETTLRQIAADPRVVIVGFANDPLALASAQVVKVRVIPAFTERVSVADPHPNVVGNQQIAETIKPAFAELVKRSCTKIF